MSARDDDAARIDAVAQAIEAETHARGAALDADPARRMDALVAVERVRQAYAKGGAPPVLCESLTDASALLILGEVIRAILEGRTTMPTLAEIGAHSKTHGGRWLVQGGTVDMHMAPRSTARLSVWPDAADAPYEDEGAETWLAERAGVCVLPIDGDDRPCAWPVVAEDGAP